MRMIITMIQKERQEEEEEEQICKRESIGLESELGSQKKISLDI